LTWKAQDFNGGISITSGVTEKVFPVPEARTSMSN